MLLTTAKASASVSRARGAGFQGPRFDGRARHHARRGGQRDLHGDLSPYRGDARGARAYLQDAPRGCRRGWRGDGEAAGEDAEEETPYGVDLGRSAMRKCPRPSRSFSPFRQTATASGPRPTNIASPGAAAKASSRWRSTSATARSSPRFRSSMADEIMLVTDGGQLIRCPVEGIRVAGRVTQGVIVLQHGARASTSSRSSGSARRREEGDEEDQTPEPESEPSE